MPIRDIGGRFRSIRDHADLAKALSLESQSLSPEERQVVEQILEEILMGQQSQLYSEIHQSVFRIEPVPMTKFLSDPYFLGAVGKTLYPKVKESLCEIFSGQYKIAFWGGGLGVGKSTAGCIAVLRMIYEVSCLRDPHSAYGISKSDTISFPCISVTEDVAERNLVEKIRAFISESPYFSQEFSPVRNTQGKGVMFPNRILIPPGASTEAAVLGTNSLGCLIDEGNFFGRRRYSKEDNQQNKSNIEIIYEGMKRRIESRFMSRGKLPGIMFVGSSKRSVDSFTEREIRKNIDRHDVYVCEYANWEVHPEGRYGKERFLVAVGNETQQSRILKEGESAEGMLTIEVPMEFYDSFYQDLDQAIRDLAGISTVSITPFIARREKIQEAITPERSHPFNQEVWDMSFPGKIDWHKLAVPTRDGGWKPRLNPEAPRHVHLDLSKTGDRTGFSVCHVAGYTPIQRLGSNEQEMAPVIEVDFALSLQAPRAGEIIYSEVRRLIYEFSRHGFFIKLVSADQFQSTAVLQSLSSQGYQTKVVSVEPAGGPYEQLKLALYENRLKFYNYPPLIKELRELQKNWKTGKVDHPDTGSKDIADTIAANINTLSATAFGVYDKIIVSDSLALPESDTWILEEPKTVVVESGKSWSGGFALPFEMG